MANVFNPWDAVLSGQQAEQGLAQAQLEGLNWRERLALKRAAGALGSQNYFAGYEGVPGAERPGYLRDAWANADPAQAQQLEGLVAEPFKVQRGIETAGKIAAGKYAAEYGAFGNFIDGRNAKLMPGRNAMGTRLQGEGRTSVASSGTDDLPLSDLQGLSATKQSIGFSHGSPTYSEETLSPLEQQRIIGEELARREATNLGKKKYGQDDLQHAIGNVQKAQQVFREAQAAQFENPSASGQVNLAHQELRVRRQELDALQRRMAASAPLAAAPLQGTSEVVPEDDLVGYDPQGELTRLPPSAPSSGAGQPGQAPSAPPSPRTLSPAPLSGSPFGIPGAEQLSGRKQQEVGEKEVIVARDRARGQQIARSVIGSLRKQFTQLNDMGGITNTEKDAAGNIVAGASSSLPGQYTGKLLGTKTQSLRNTIAQQRPLLMQSIMKASGMTAKQMDSNVELKLWLATATDPTLDFQANMKALDTLEQLFSQDPGTAAPTPNTSKTGVAPFHDADKERRYQEFKKTHK